MMGDGYTWLTKPFAELTLKELYAVLKLRQDVFIVEQECYYADIDSADDAAMHMLVVGSNEQLVAYLRLFEPGVRCNEASIGRIIVSPIARGVGLGKRLVEQGIGYCRSAFADAGIRIEAQAHLQNFYGDCGFETVSEPRMVDGIPHVDMLWRG
jgi:ElaA protein